MKTATLNIARQITLIEGSKVTIEKMGNFQTLINEYNVIELTGMCKPTKLNKYKQLLIENGFVQSNVYWCDNAGFSDNNSDVLNFRISFEKY
jgi:hypothetical protein